MNASDEKSVVAFFRELLEEGHSNTPVVAFDSSHITGKVRNTRRNRAMEDINDILSGSDTCVELGGIYTVCEYESNVWFLIKAELATSATSLFDPAKKTIAAALCEEDDE